MSVKLLPTTFEKIIINKTEFAALPAYLQPMINGLDHIWKITLTPHKAADCGHCCVVVEAPYNFGQGHITLQNLGRLPLDGPAPHLDDLRPTAFYVWGTGSQKFRTVVKTANNIYVDTLVAFE